MKQSKKLLAILLTLALTLTLAAPAAFADEEGTEPAINWDDFYITAQPPEELSLPFGSDITLRVEVNAPEGTEVTYQWLVSAEGASGQELRLSPGDSSYPRAAQPYSRASAAYYCTITAVELNEDGEAVDSRTLTTWASVVISAEREKTFWDTVKEKLTNIWRTMQALGLMIALPFAILVQFAGVIGRAIIDFFRGIFS